MTLVEKLLALVAKNNPYDLSEFLDDTHDIDVAVALEDFDHEQLKQFLSLLNQKQIALLLEEADEDLQLRIVAFYSNETLVDLFALMSNDDVADILGEMSTQRRKDVLKYMKRSDSRTLELILSYGEDTAGGIMTTEFIALKANLTVQEALAKIVSIGPETEVIEVILVTDNSHRLMGTLDLRHLFMAKADTALSEIYEDNPIFVYPTDDQELATQLVRKYDLKVLPVVNKRMAILGIITIDDIIDVMVEEHSEDMLAMSGVSADEEYDSSLLESIKARLPWLGINLFAAFGSSAIISLFEGTISQVVALAATMPIITGMGGNAGSQTLSVVLTNIATGELNFDDDWRLVFKEIGLALFNGLSIGLAAGSVMGFKHANLYLGLITAIAMTLNMIIAGIAGFLIPLVLKKVGVDPALASSIFLTTCTDICGFFIFLSLATVALPMLL